MTSAGGLRGALLTCALLVMLSGPSAQAASPARARVLSSTQIDARRLELTLTTPALATPTKVRVLLPSGYERSPRRHFPVLYLLHGAGDDHTGWTRSGDVQGATADRPLIVVMPDGGRGGWYTDWRNGGRGGPPQWERYHVDQVVRLLDRRFRTIPARRGRAIAGLSMGGFGALSYAGRHPDLFASAASFSGGVDLNLRLDGQPAGRIVVGATAVRDGGREDSVFGDFVRENIRWRGHNPPDLASNLRGLALGLYTGNGQPGGPLGGDAFDVIEFSAHEMSVSVHRRLERLGIHHRWSDYGPGAHTWPYWARDLRRALPWMMRRFRHPVAPPARITYTSIERSYTVFGWRVVLRRPSVEFSTLRRAGARGFALSGSGRATVTTPARFRPRQRYLATIRSGRATVQRGIEADRAGRLRIRLRLAHGTARVRIAPPDQGRPASPRE